MPRPKNLAEDFLPMSAVDFAVLLVLADGANHGYAVVKEIDERTDGQVKLLPGNLYAILQRLTKQGMIAEAGEVASSGGGKRRNYRITAFGRKVAGAEASRMKRMVEAAASSDLLGTAGR